ncbi:MAG: hypothetical protein B7Y45_09710 [Sphingomonas sp. 28-66-16]|nr:MAG: hypothetical protein B7Y45_09710 [Sphingomonas sp. 28-66-16]
MRTTICALLAGSMIIMATPVWASQDDRNGYQQIKQGDLVAAEAIINRERRLFAGDPDLMLNLATVYQRTNRLREARGLYLQILSRPDEQMMIGSDSYASAHALARAALTRLDGAQITSR